MGKSLFISSIAKDIYSSYKPAEAICNKDNFCTRLFLITTAVIVILCDYSCCAHKPNIGLFVFGDSIFDPGNNHNLNNTNVNGGNSYIPRADYFPYGQTFFKYPTGRFSNGRLIPDFIAEFAQLPLIPAFLENGPMNKWAYGVNFASGGSGALVETRVDSVIHLKTQLGQFENVEKELISKFGNKEAQHLLSESVYLFSVGGNDIMVASSSEFSSYPPEDYASIVIGNFTQVIKELHKKGARKFGFVNVIPLGCLPLFRAHNEVNIGECDEKLISFTKLYNAALAQRLEELQKQLKGFHYSYFDSFTSIMNIIDNPSKYGLKEARSACCGSGAFRGTLTCGGMRGGIQEYELCKDHEEYFFFDSVHPSEKGHRILAELMWEGVPNITWPLNLKSLFQLTSYNDEEEVIQGSASTDTGIKIENLYLNDEL